MRFIMLGVIDAIKNTPKLKTLIIIAHRLATVKNCDVAYMINRGEIIDQRTYGELINSN